MGGGGENIRDREGGWGEEKEGCGPAAARCGGGELTFDGGGDGGR